MIRFYLTPFDDNGDFSAEIDITADVDKGSLGKIRRSLDNSVYDIGVLRYNNLNIKLFNSQGKFSDVDNLRSVFRYRRAGSKLRVTWAPAEFAYCGVAICGEALLSEEVTIYRGILNDDAAKMNADDQIVQFQILSYDSQLSKLLVPHDDLELTDTLKDVLFKILNQESLTEYVTVLEANLDLDIDYVPDDWDWFINRGAKDAIEKILACANAVLYIDDLTVRVTGRTPSAEVVKSFYGQASQLGNENILSIDDFRSGQNRLINLLRWRDSGAGSSDSFSIDRWGVYTKEVDVEFITDTAKQIETAESIVAEFKDPKKEFQVLSVIDADTIALKFLDRINLDYPTVIESAGRYFPVVGVTKVGDADSPLPHTLWDFQINSEDEFKIMELELDLKQETIALGVREI